MQNFILAPCMNERSQHAFFFVEVGNGFQIHFTSFETIEDGQQLQKWHLIRIKEDFIKKMGKFGRLPVGSLDATLKLTLKYDRARAACNPIDYMQDYTEEKIKKLNALPHEFVKYKPSMNAFTPLFPLYEHKKILAATIDEYDQKLDQTVTKVVHE